VHQLRNVSLASLLGPLDLGLLDFFGSDNSFGSVDDLWVPHLSFQGRRDHLPRLKPVDRIHAVRVVLVEANSRLGLGSHSSDGAAE